MVSCVSSFFLSLSPTQILALSRVHFCRCCCHHCCHCVWNCMHEHDEYATKYAWQWKFSLPCSIRIDRHRDVTAKSTIGEMIIPNDRYQMHESESSMYAVQMTLTIKHLQKPDFGGYRCISKNSIGGIEATIRLYGKLCIWNFTLTEKIGNSSGSAKTKSPLSIAQFVQIIEKLTELVETSRNQNRKRKAEKMFFNS